MERSGRKFEKPKSDEHRDAYLALTGYCMELTKAHSPEPEDSDLTRDLTLESKTAELSIEIPISQLEEVFTNLTRVATSDDGIHAQITYYTQTQDEIWRKLEYQSYDEVMAEMRSSGGAPSPDISGSFEEVYGVAIDTDEAFRLIEELIESKVEEDESD